MRAAQNLKSQGAISALVIAFLVVALFGLRGVRGGVTPAVERKVLNTEDSKDWFYDGLYHEDISDSELESLTRYAWTRLGGGAQDTEPVQNSETRIVAVTVVEKDRLPRVVIGTGGSPRGALESALRKLSSIGAPTAIRVDLVTQAIQFQGFKINLPIDHDRGLMGFALDKSSGMFLLPGEIEAHALLSERKTFDLNRTASYLRNTDRPDQGFMALTVKGESPAYGFLSQAAFTDGQTYHSLYRSHRKFGILTPELLLASAKSGGEYLKRSINEQGRFVYSFDAARETQSSEYNILRHAGTLYSMLELYEVTKDQELLSAVTRGITFLRAQIKPCAIDQKEYRCLVEGDKVKVGGHGLAILALTRYANLSGDKEALGDAQQLARWLVGLQGQHGEFRAHIVIHPSGQFTEFRSEYYPGEALYGLVTLFEADKNQEWLKASEKLANYIVNIRDIKVPTAKLPHDHWMLYGLNALYPHQKEIAYVNHTMRLVDAIIAGQNRNPEYPDWYGSYYTPPRTAPAATRSEGMVSAYSLLSAAGKRERLSEVQENIELATRYQLMTQIQPESAIYLSNPAAAIGGFRGSFENYEIRIDYVQHNISALLGLRRILLADSSSKLG